MDTHIVLLNRNTGDIPVSLDQLFTDTSAELLMTDKLTLTQIITEKRFYLPIFYRLPLSVTLKGTVTLVQLLFTHTFSHTHLNTYTAAEPLIYTASSQLVLLCHGKKTAANIQV